MTTNFEPHDCVIFVQSTKIGTHKNKAIHIIVLLLWFSLSVSMVMCPSRFDLLNTIETKWLCAFSSNLTDMSVMKRG